MIRDEVSDASPASVPLKPIVRTVESGMRKIKYYFTVKNTYVKKIPTQHTVNFQSLGKLFWANLES